MAKVLISGHGKGARSPLLKDISDETARELVGAIKHIKTAQGPCKAGRRVSGKRHLLKIPAANGEILRYRVSSKKIKVG